MGPERLTARYPGSVKSSQCSGGRSLPLERTELLGCCRLETMSTLTVALALWLALWQRSILSQTDHQWHSGYTFANILRYLRLWVLAI